VRQFATLQLNIFRLIMPPSCYLALLIAIQRIAKRQDSVTGGMTNQFNLRMDCGEIRAAPSPFPSLDLTTHLIIFK
jgi:hypothetical protein